VPAPAASARDRVASSGIAPIGANACASWDASAIISPTPAAANKTVFLMDCHLLLSIAARREKSVFGPERQSDRAPQRSSFHHPVSAGFGHRISEGAGQKAALAGEQF
jgi:hypothetical protein